MNNEQKPQLTIPRVIGSLSFFNADNLEIMKGFKDNEFDLAIVDPPYGINADRPHSEGNGWIYRETAGWDKNAPDASYFDELKRVSKNQIIWGANHFLDNMPFNLSSPCWLLWDKGQREFSLADGELAWTSFKTALRIFSMSRGAAMAKDKKTSGRFHPTQKPIELYDWIIKNYAEPNQKILDTHLGSGSIAIAIEKANRLDKMNLQFVGIEIDKEYFEKALNRIEQYCRQGTLSF